jgi:hypothetical protein
MVKAFQNWTKKSGFQMLVILTIPNLDYFVGFSNGFGRHFEFNHSKSGPFRPVCEWLLNSRP